MPIFIFQCQNCDHVYETLTKYDETKKYKSVKCSECNSKKKKQLPHTCSWQWENPVGTDRWGNSHDYRFHTKLDEARQQRTQAEQASRVGNDPYPHIDDVSSGNNFGKVK